MLDADMNARYWKILVGSYSARDKYLKIFMAVVASGTVAAWGIWTECPSVWRFLSGLSAIIAVVLPILDDQKSIGQMSFLSGKWGELRIEYENLWLKVESYGVSTGSGEIDTAFKEFRKMESSLQEKETELPTNKKLLMKCFQEVKKTRGLM